MELFSLICSVWAAVAATAVAVMTGKKQKAKVEPAAEVREEEENIRQGLMNLMCYGVETKEDKE